MIVNQRILPAMARTPPKYTDITPFLTRRLDFESDPTLRVPANTQSSQPLQPFRSVEAWQMGYAFGASDIQQIFGVSEWTVKNWLMGYAPSPKYRRMLEYVAGGYLQLPETFEDDNRRGLVSAKPSRPSQPPTVRRVPTAQPTPNPYTVQPSSPANARPRPVPVRRIPAALSAQNPFISPNYLPALEARRKEFFAIVLAEQGEGPIAPYRKESKAQSFTEWATENQLTAAQLSRLFLTSHATATSWLNGSMPKADRLRRLVSFVSDGKLPYTHSPDTRCAYCLEVDAAIFLPDELVVLNKKKVSSFSTPEVEMVEGRYIDRSADFRKQTRARLKKEGKKCACGAEAKHRKELDGRKRRFWQYRTSKGLAVFTPKFARAIQALPGGITGLLKAVGLQLRTVVRWEEALPSKEHLYLIRDYVWANSEGDYDMFPLDQVWKPTAEMLAKYPREIKELLK